jgi:regulatory LuxR family protein
VPIDPPICWPVLSVAEATPASCGATPNVPVFIDGAIVKPKPRPAAISGPSTSYDEIAGAMVLSPATAKTHVSRAMIKLGARDRAQLVVFAYQAGLVAPRASGQAQSR